MERQAHASDAVRLLEHWYKALVDDFVQEARAAAPAPAGGEAALLTGPLLAQAHELAWRHGIVRAARESDPASWAAMTVAHEAAAYEHLLGWLSVTYAVEEDEIRASQTKRGYRHHAR